MNQSSVEFFFPEKIQTSTLNTVKFLENQYRKQGNLLLLWRKLCSKTKLQTYEKDFSESKMYTVTILTLASINAYFRIMLFFSIHQTCSHIVFEEKI